MNAAIRLKNERARIHGAMGAKDGDYIELHNQWAKVIIEKREGKFVVSGDIKALREAELSFTTSTAAMAYALDSLTEYEKGACR